jgi:hypothetical protein
MFVIWLKGMWSKDLGPFKHNDQLDSSQAGVPSKEDMPAARSLSNQKFNAPGMEPELWNMPK